MYLKDGPIKRLENLRHRRVGWPGLAIDLPILGAMLEAKFQGMSDAVLGATQTAALVEACWAVGGAGDIRALTALARP